MNNDLKIYLENTKKPWNILFYRVVWEQLSQITNSKILDFGSGLGITANHLAKNNDVVAIEPNTDMVEERICENSYWVNEPLKFMAERDYLYNED
jgi:S-adenosylmethionine-dependent methyltransferase